jgi:hypothetical protein
MPDEINNILVGIRQLQDLQKQQKQDPHKLIQTIIAIFTVVCVIAGGWVTIQLTTQALRKDFTNLAIKIDKMESLWLAVPIMEASHNNFKMQYKFEQKDLNRRVVVLESYH